MVSNLKFLNKYESIIDNSSLVIWAACVLLLSMDLYASVRKPFQAPKSASKNTYLLITVFGILFFFLRDVILPAVLVNNNFSKGLSRTLQFITDFGSMAVLMVGTVFSSISLIILRNRVGMKKINQKAFCSFLM